MILEKRYLGQTNIQLTSLGFGGASVGNLYQAMSDESASLTVKAAWDAGLHYFDTAPYYGFGLSERRLGDVLRHQDRKGFCVSTKVGRLLEPDSNADTSVVRRGFASPMPFKPVYDYSYDGVMRSHEDSLQRLGLAKVDILLVHDIGRATHGDDNDRHFHDLEKGGYRALDELRSNGDISAVGLGVNEWEVCEEAMEIGQFDCFLLAGRYTLLEQSAIDSFFPKCQAHGASVILGGAYNSGILATGTRKKGVVPHYNYEPAAPEVVSQVRKIEDVADSHGVTLAAAALQFPLAHEAVVSVIPGLGNASRIAQTINLYQEVIPPQFWEDLRAGGLIKPGVPLPSDLRPSSDLTRPA